MSLLATAGRATLFALIVAGAGRVIANRTLVHDIRRDLARRRPFVDLPGDLRLTVVVPAYGEEQRIAESVRQITAALEPVQVDGGVEIVVVDDGSEDETAERAEAAGVRVVRLPENCGKGAAVRAGVLVARGRTVAFTDADLSQPPGDLLLLLAKVESGWDVAVGTRHHSAAQKVARGALVRWCSTYVFNLLTALVLLGGYRDTQCGCKAFRSDVARHLFSRARIDGFAFDVELFHMVERYRMSCIQVPVMRRPSVSSTIRLGPHAIQMVRDLLRIRRWSRQGAYDLTGEDADLRPRSRQPAAHGPV